jgi:hypothetical protein
MQLEQCNFDYQPYKRRAGYYIKGTFCPYYLLLLLLTMLITSSSYGQQLGNWYSYYDQKTDLTGYKNGLGQVKLSPRFGGLTKAVVFRNIIAVTDQRTNTSYYLLKNGNIRAKDSLYVWDMTFDCEQEGKIRFRDPKTDKVGFLGIDGKISIGALYSDAQPFHNGLALVLYNGKRICGDGSAFSKQTPCEHWTWDGVTALIDQKGNIVADSLDIDNIRNVNWNSMHISNEPANTALRISLKAKNGRYLSFINYEKEFTQWFNNEYLNNILPASEASLFNTVCVEGLFNNQIRKMYPSKTFYKAFGQALQLKLQRIKTIKTKLQIIPDALNTMIYTQKQFKTYYTDCGDANVAEYPLFNVVVSYAQSSKQTDYQEHFSFLRTSNGYKLIEVAWKNMR